MAKVEGCKMQSSGPFKRDLAKFRLKTPENGALLVKGLACLLHEMILTLPQHPS
jgi:hypothetical protein